MNYKHLSQIERYQIHSLMKAQHNITQIARLLGRDKSTISRELRRNAGCRGYRAKQACELACKRSESSRNANTLAPWVKEQASALLRLQWSPEQIAGKLPVSHESLYLHVYADKAHGGTLFLDEIGDLALDLQANLLRFLQEHTIQKVGSNRTLQVDARVIAASHIDLASAVASARDSRAVHNEPGICFGG